MEPNSSTTDKVIPGLNFSCYDCMTQVLTNRGWIYFENLTTNDYVATLVDGEKLVYEQPSEVQKYLYKGKMYKIATEQVNLCVTPNHNMWVSSGLKAYSLEKAEDIYGKIKFYQKNVKQYLDESMAKKSFAIPAFGTYERRIVNMDAWLTFFGICLSYGHIPDDYECNYEYIWFRKNYPKVKDIQVKNELLASCKELGFIIIDRKINDAQLVNFFKPLCVSRDERYFPSWVWKLTTTQCKKLIHAMMLGGFQLKYDTLSTKLANGFQRLCLHAGWCSNVEVGQYKTYRLTIIKKLNPKVEFDEWIDYDDYVHCCTVTSGVIYVRRMNTPVFSGNSRSAQMSTVGIKLRRADMPFTENGLVPEIIVNPYFISNKIDKINSI